MGLQTVGHDLATEQQKQHLKHFIHVSQWAIFHLEIHLFLRFSPPAPGNLSRGHWCQHFLSSWHEGGGCAGRCGRWKGDGKWEVLALVARVRPGGWGCTTGPLGLSQEAQQWPGSSYKQSGIWSFFNEGFIFLFQTFSPYQQPAREKTREGRWGLGGSMG